MRNGSGIAGVRSPYRERKSESERVLFIAHQVQALYGDREEHGEVDVPFRNVYIETFQNQGKADQNQERERQHFYGRVAVNKLADRARREHHHADGNHNCRHHDKQMIREAHRRDDGIKAENNIQHHDLDNRAQEGGDARFQPFFLAFNRFVNFFTGFPDQEQPTQQQDQIAGGNRFAENLEQRVCQACDPGDRSQQSQAHHHRRRQPKASGVIPLRCRKFRHHQREENNIVDPKNDLQQRQRTEREPGVRIGYPCK
ncbi:hypothetical protein CKO_04204 [Citrobacter koseri ATCC BAA-895]|uniref:Uncharacterized protein n=1 Tax=Citrobacter koseri (strain ATCC BAA-895 / CDC 4225-83 / SGSC4696) TaxID=290338 RepID=A8AP52_CITK8|nr:hypothetical protein CKO_04204 [Citrobacter koseri ATCC BAA-895]